MKIRISATFIFILLFALSNCYSQTLNSLSECELSTIEIKPSYIDVSGLHERIFRNIDILLSEETKPITLLRALTLYPKVNVYIKFNHEAPKEWLDTVIAPKNWVTKEDVADLIQYVNSKQPASSVACPYSSVAPMWPESTVGIEAMCLILIYRGLGYPFFDSSISFFPLEKQTQLAEECLQWWDDEKNMIPPTEQEKMEREFQQWWEDERKKLAPTQTEDRSLDINK